MSMDLVIEVDNEPGALAQVAQAISDAGVNIAAATCVGLGAQAELHILVPHAEAARHALALSNLAVTREREVVVVEVDDRPGILAELAGKVAANGVNLDLVYCRHQEPRRVRLDRPRRRPRCARRRVIVHCVPRPRRPSLAARSLALARSHLATGSAP